MKLCKFLLFLVNFGLTFAFCGGVGMGQISSNLPIILGQISSNLPIILGQIASNLPSIIEQENIRIERYFKSLQGEWQGGGKVTNGKYKNTKFTCYLTGKVPEQIGMDIDGYCKIGFFKQNITAKVVKQRSNYSGIFLGGADGDGLDIKRGILRNNKFTAALTRENINGAIIVNGQKKNIMEITIAVEYQGLYYPIIDLEVERVTKNKKRKRWILP